MQSTLEDAQRSIFENDDPTSARPVLKWAGGKGRLLTVLRRYVPERYSRYIEPFLGGGALFFSLAPECAILGDSNPELIAFYKTVGNRPEDVLREINHLQINESEYYRIRSLEPDELPSPARAARFLYLNKTCYNGLYRVNKEGRFNTPFGKYKGVRLVEPGRFRAASQLLQRATINCADYQKTLASAHRGDFVYLDPPYLPVGKYSDFKRYTKEFFYEDDHRKLADEFRRLDGIGCTVLLSNSYHPTIAALYKGFQQRTVRVPRFVNCKGDGRGNVKELLISNFVPQF